MLSIKQSNVPFSFSTDQIGQCFYLFILERTIVLAIPKLEITELMSP